ncbi:hypothetical protein LXL04_024759 [Taraxacum kok-saghyz]
MFSQYINKIQGILEPQRTVGSMDLESDRLSSLPDDLIHKILSFIYIEDAIRTSYLSSRWRYIWTLTPNLNFENLNRGSRISKFFSSVLSHRNNQTQICSINLVLGATVMDNECITQILNCAFAHNVQQLSITRSRAKIVGRPLFYGLSSIPTPTWDLRALTTLHLHFIQLSDDNFFSKYTNLKNLSLRKCSLIKGKKVLNICLPRLSNLSLEYLRPGIELVEHVNVVAPQLENLSIKYCDGKQLISAPRLITLVIEGYHPWEISTPGFPSLEKVDLWMLNVSDADTHKIVSLLQQLHNAKFLIISLGILKRLFHQRKLFSSSMELIPNQACAFANAKILKFQKKMPLKVYLEVQAQEKVSTSTELKNYETSPSAIFPMVSHEEIKVMVDMVHAHVFVKHLGMLLKQYKKNTNDIIKAHLDEHGKPEVKKQWERELQLNLGEMMALIEKSKFVASEICLMWTQCMSYRRATLGIIGTLEIIAWLQEIRSLFQCIEGLMAQLSASKRDVMYPNYFRLCEDGANFTNNILERMKTRKETHETNSLII